MKKLIMLTMSSLSFSSICLPVHAANYYNQANSETNWTQQQQTRKEILRRGHFSISVDMPSDQSDQPPTPPPYPHHGFPRPRWLPMTRGQLVPNGAVVGGGEAANPSLYVCRASYQGGVHPGKLLGDSCNISWGGREIPMPRYEVLVSYAPLNWVPASNGEIPANAIPGGFEDGHPLYICQANYNGGVHPGKIIGANCNIAWGGREISIPYYNVLVR